MGKCSNVVFTAVHFHCSSSDDSSNSKANKSSEGNHRTKEKGKEAKGKERKTNRWCVCVPPIKFAF